MRKLVFLGVVTGIMIFMGINATCTKIFADSSDMDIDQGIANQGRRIEEGFRSGELTQSEARMVQDNLNYVLDQTTRLKADGKLTEEERERLHRMLDQNSDMIYDRKHNPIKAFRPSTEASYLDERIANQFGRIDDGIHLGYFTRQEKRILIDNLDYVGDQEARFKADGIFPVAERKQLHTLLDRNSSMIGKQEPVKTLRPGIGSPGIDQRVADQQRKIDQGIISQELTRGEARTLQDNLNYIQREEARLKADGSLTHEERERLHQMLDENSDIIYDKKHNPVRRFY